MNALNVFSQQMARRTTEPASSVPYRSMNCQVGCFDFDRRTFGPSVRENGAAASERTVELVCFALRSVSIHSIRRQQNEVF